MKGAHNRKWTSTNEEDKQEFRDYIKSLTKKPWEYKIGCDCKFKHDICYCDDTCGKFEEKKNAASRKVSE